MTREDELLAAFNDPEGVIDDAEELLEEIPGWLEQIVAAGRLARVVGDYCRDAQPGDRPTKHMCLALAKFEKAGQAG